MTILREGFVGRITITGTKISQGAGATLVGGLKDANWQQGRIDKEPGAGDDRIDGAVVADAVAFQIDLLKVQWIIAENR